MTDHDPNPSSDLPHPLPPDPSSDDTIRVLSGPPSPSADTHGDPGGRPRTVLPLPVIEGYEVIEEIGRGGMGVVYCAKQLAAGGRVVALKVMLGEAFARPEELRRFEREVEIASGLNHPNIARIYDSGLTHGRHYFAMEFIDGVPLDLYCKTRALRIDDRLQLFTTVCEAVACAHRRGIIHRDLKPSNILVDVEGNPHVLDFGLAKTHSDDESAERRSLLTIDGTVLGTLPYMAPEQAEGHTSAIDTRTDVYALGVILYELLTGKFPYEVTGQMAEVLKRIAEAEPKRPSTVNRLIGNEVETIILRALHKAPDRRYTGADDLARDVARFLAHEPIEAKRDSGWYVLRKTMRRHRVSVAVVLSIVMLIAVAAVTSFALYRKAEAQRNEAEIARTEEQRQRGIAQMNEQNAVASKKEAEISQQKASASEKEVTHRLALQFFNEGIGWWFDRQDAAKASACFAEALRVSPEPFPAARMALNNAMKQCPQMCGFPVPATEDSAWVSVSPDGKRVLASSSEGSRWQIWDTTTGRPMPSPMEGDHALFAPDGKRFLVVKNQIARLFDASTGRLVSPPMEHGQRIFKAVFSPDGKRLVTVSDKSTVLVWDIVTGKPVTSQLERVSGQAIPIYSGRPVIDPSEVVISGPVFFDPNAKLLVVTPNDGRVQILDVATGRIISTSPKGFEGSGFSADGKQILGYTPDGVQAFDVNTWNPVSTAIPIVDQLWSSSSYSPDGERVLTTDIHTARVWNAATGLAISASMVHGGWVRSASFSSDGKWVVTGSEDKTARVWGAATGGPMFAPMHHQWVCREARFSLGMDYVLTVSTLREGAFDLSWQGRSVARVWSLPLRGVDTEIQIQHPNPGIRDADGHRIVDWRFRASFSPDGGRVLTSGDRTARVWDATTGQAISAPMAHGGWVRSASFSPHGKWVVTGSADNTARVWDAATGEPVSAPIQPVSADIERGNEIDFVGFSPNGLWVITKVGKTLQLWDAATSQPFSPPIEHDAHINSVAFSPDSKWISVAGYTPGKDKVAMARLWDLKTRKFIATPFQHDATIRSASFSPDGKRLLTASDDKTARVWNAATGQPACAPMAHKRGVVLAKFSPEGKRILTVTADMSIHVWDAASGVPISTHAASSNSAPVNFSADDVAARFSPDGRWVITAERATFSPGLAEKGYISGSVRLLDIGTGQPVSQHMHQDCVVTAVDFSPDGKRALMASTSGQVRIWTIDDVDWDEPIDLIQARVRARLGVAVSPTGNVQALSTEELAAAWRDYQRLQADYERTHPEKARRPAERIAPPPSAPVTTPSPRPIAGPNPAAPLPPASTAGPFTYTIDKNTVTITRYTGQGANVVIPDQINGQPVTGIGEKAFMGCANLLDVTIPVTVTSMGGLAFSKCPNLTGVRFIGNAPVLGQDVF